ncbi:MAG TPA: hypothetical protein VNI01_04685 [Elusimicrobiota bacterium]|jgi:hypothetical protein|nr:hypothetical protein [Elusimicrobiota bacterium]
MRNRLLAACALLVLAAGCGRKYARFSPSWGGFRCEAPWAWRVFEEAQGSDYAAVTFAGPLDRDFYLGTPSLSVRWHAYGRPHVLRDGGAESYSSVEDYLERMPREVYGPDVQVLAREKVGVAGREGYHLRLVSPVEVPAWRRYGVSQEEGGSRPVNLRDHSYVLVPCRTGFYVIVYPATRQGYDKYKDRFHELANSFRVLREGPL